MTNKQIHLLAQLSRDRGLYDECKGADLDGLQALGLLQWFDARSSTTPFKQDPRPLLTSHGISSRIDYAWVGAVENWRGIVGPEISAKVDAIDEIDAPSRAAPQRVDNEQQRTRDGEDHAMSETDGERSTGQEDSNSALSRDQYDAVLLDLDGVITDTASVHAACWKQMFDEYLQKRAAQRGEAFRPFDIATDYRLYVDGKPRYDGVRDFLTSRGIQLPEGRPEDSPEAETVGGLGNRKNELVNKIIEEKGVEPYEGSVELIRQLRDRGFKIAVVTSSQNCTAVLKAAKLDHFFDVQVDGNVIHAQHLAGKPAPDSYLMAAKLLGIDPARAIVIEDALSGVEAGRNGNFGLVIGVARKGNAEELRRHGAHLVVNDLGELAG